MGAVAPTGRKSEDHGFLLPAAAWDVADAGDVG
jgi:hypothetical protein